MTQITLRRGPAAPQRSDGVAAARHPNYQAFEAIDHPVIPASMPHDQLFEYVRDHLDAAYRSLDLLDYLREHAADPAMKSEAERLSAEAKADREVLEYLARELRGGSEYATAKPRWRASRRNRARFSARGDGPLPQLAVLECVGLGLLGRVALWEAFIAMAVKNPGIPRLDYRGLRTRAKEQHTRVDSFRRRLALDALPAALV